MPHPPDQWRLIRDDRIARARRTLILWSILWVPMGAGTIAGFAGRPDDAPHLHLSETARGCLWIVTGLAALAVLMLGDRRSETHTRAAAGLLVLMPSVRAISYAWAWGISLGGADGLGVGQWWQEGSPSGWYTCLPWVILVAGIVSQATDTRPVRCARRVLARIGRD